MLSQAANSVVFVALPGQMPMAGFGDAFGVVGNQPCFGNDGVAMGQAPTAATAMGQQLVFALDHRLQPAPQQGESQSPQTVAKPAARRKMIKNQKLGKKATSAIADTACSASQEAGTAVAESGQTQISRWRLPEDPTSRASAPSAFIAALTLEPLRSNTGPSPGRQLPPPAPAFAPKAPPKTTQGPPASPPSPTLPTPQAPKKTFKLKNAPKPKTGSKGHKENNENQNFEKLVAEATLVTNILDEIPRATQENQVKEKLTPPDKVYDKKLMLRVWRLQRSEVHPAVLGLGVAERPWRPNPRSANNSEIRRPERDSPVLEQSEKAYRITKPTSPMEALDRNVCALLNKICPENLDTIVEKLANIELQKAAELECVIKAIFGKALVEPHYCETYADMVFALQKRYPEFPPENEGERPLTFTRVMLNTVQNEFESLPTTFEPTDDDKAKFPDSEDLQREMKKRKDKMLANMKFIGNLFLRQLLSIKVIGQVVKGLIGIKDGNALPKDHMIECVCELLQAIGSTVDSEKTPQGKALMDAYAARLKDIKAAFSMRIQVSIENLLQLRKNRWQKKLFKEQAKTKAVVRDEFDQAQKAQQNGGRKGSDSVFSFQTAGARPSYIDAIANQKERAKADTCPEHGKFEKVKKMCEYFADDKDGESLQQDWAKAEPSDKEAKQGVEWLLETGFEDSKKADITAATLAELMKRCLVSWDTFKECFSTSLSALPDLKMDAPNCDVMVHCLIARLLMLENFNQVVLKPMQTFVSHNENRDLGWSLMLGIVKKLKHENAQDVVRKALNMSEFISCAATARKTTVPNARKQLQSA